VGGPPILDQRTGSQVSALLSNTGRARRHPFPVGRRECVQTSVPARPARPLRRARSNGPRSAPARGNPGPPRARWGGRKEAGPRGGHPNVPAGRGTWKELTPHLPPRRHVRSQSARSPSCSRRPPASRPGGPWKDAGADHRVARLRSLAFAGNRPSRKPRRRSGTARPHPRCETPLTHRPAGRRPGGNRRGIRPDARAVDERAAAPCRRSAAIVQRLRPCLILIDEWGLSARQLHAQSDLPAGSVETHFTRPGPDRIGEAARRCLVAISLPASGTGGSPHIRAEDVEVGGARGRKASDRLRNGRRRDRELLAGLLWRGTPQHRCPPWLARGDDRAVDGQWQRIVQ
jgi:hypothetical protein